MLTDGLSFLLKGGPVMWPLFLCALVALTVLIERYFALRSILRGSSSLAADVRDAVLQRQPQSAQRILEARGGPVARLLLVAVKNGNLPKADLESLISEVAVEETPNLSRGMTALDTIITVAPLLGLLGTVTGMIQSFQVVGLASGTAMPAAITGGVAQALIATATGLAIAIVTLVGYNYLSDQVRRIVSQMEVGATKVVNAFQMQQRANAAANGAAPAETSYAAARV